MTLDRNAMLLYRCLALLLAFTFFCPPSMISVWAEEEVEDKTADEVLTPSGGLGLEVGVPMTGGTLSNTMKEGGLPLSSNMALTEPIDPSTYIVGPGDRFIINFWGERNEHLPISISPEGITFIPNVGEFKPGAVTLADFKKLVSRKIGKIYKGLDWDVLLVTPRSFGLYVLGNVKNPGLHRANGLTRVSNVLSQAGGATKAGSRRSVEIRRGDEVIYADLLKFNRFADKEANPFVRENDVIYVPYKGKSVTLRGPLRSSGAYELVEGEDNIDTLINVLGGGPKPFICYTEPSEIRYIAEGGVIRKMEFDLLKALEDPEYAATLPIVDLAVISIPDIADIAPTVKIEGAIYGKGDRSIHRLRAEGGVLPQETSQVFGMTYGDTALDLLQKAGGATPWADTKGSYIERTNRETGEVQTIPVDFDAILIQKDFSADVKLEVGDVLVVPPLERRIFIIGQVHTPGPRTYQPHLTIRDYIAIAGGPTERAKMKKSYVERKDGTKISLKDDPQILPGDHIMVPEVKVRFWQDYFTIILGVVGITLSGIAAINSTK